MFTSFPDLPLLGPREEVDCSSIMDHVMNSAFGNHSFLDIRWRGFENVPLLPNLYVRLRFCTKCLFSSGYAQPSALSSKYSKVFLPTL